MMRILQTQKNELYKIVCKSGFTKSEFEVESPKDSIFNISYSENSFVFKICRIQNDRYILERNTIHNKEIVRFEVTYEGILKSFTKWVLELKSEKVPNEWEDDIHELFPSNEYHSDDIFTENEIREINNRLNYIVGCLDSLSLDSKKQDIIVKQIGLLSEQLESSTKGEWYHLFLNILTGFIQNIIIPGSMYEEFHKILINAFKDGIKWFLK